MARIEPLTPPYTAEVEDVLKKWMPPHVAHEPLALFRVLEHHATLASRMRALGSGLLAHGVLPAIDRELIIARVCARSDCRYEWGVHAATFAEAVGLTERQLDATVRDESDTDVWSERQLALIRTVDDLDRTAHLGESTWHALRELCSDQEILELLVLCGWYRTISYLANGLLLAEEQWAAPYPTDRPSTAR